MTRFLGVDLAWGEGTARKKPNETGLALLEDTGRILDAGWARGIDAVADWVVGTAKPGDVVAVDAPLVVHNASGMRMAERQVGMGYGRWKVAANASNTGVGWQGGVALRRRLEAAGFEYRSDLEPAAPGTRTFFECYPYTTLVGMEELGYDERPRYKRLDRTVPVAEGRRRRAAACDELIRRMAGLEASDPPVSLRSHPLTREFLHTRRRSTMFRTSTARTCSTRCCARGRRRSGIGTAPRGCRCSARATSRTLMAASRRSSRPRGPSSGWRVGRGERRPVHATHSRRSDRMVPIVSASAAGFASSPTR